MEINFKVSNNSKIVGSFESTVDVEINIFGTSPNYQINYFSMTSNDGKTFKKGILNDRINTFSQPKDVITFIVSKRGTRDDKSQNPTKNTIYVSNNGSDNLTPIPSIDSNEKQRIINEFSNVNNEFKSFIESYQDNDIIDILQFTLYKKYIIVYEYLISIVAKFSGDENAGSIRGTITNSINNDIIELSSIKEKDYYLPYDSDVNLIPVPNKGFKFIGWDNDFERVESNNIVRALFAPMNDTNVSRSFWDKYKKYFIIGIIVFIFVIILIIIGVVLMNKHKKIK